MGTFEPVVSTSDEVSSRASRSPHDSGQTQSASYDQQMVSRAVATFPLRNTADAIRLLDQAEAKSGNSAQNASQAPRDQTSYRADMFGTNSSTPNFFLLEEGYIDEKTLFRLSRLYFGSVHPILPLIPYKRMPITPEHILAMARSEPHFMAAILVVASSLAGDQALHDILWQRVQSFFAEVALTGANASIEVIEGLILLSGMNLKNRGPLEINADYIRISARHGSRHRRSNVLDVGRHCAIDVLALFLCDANISKAVRLGYLLGLEQLGMQAEDVDEKLVENRDRGKVAWMCEHTLIVICYHADGQRRC